MAQRLFVAVVPPPEVVAALDHFLEPRRGSDESLRWTLPESWHLTLAFLPSVPESAVDELADALAEAVAGTGRFELLLDGAGAFPHPDRAKVLWLGVRQGSDELARLAAKCRGAAVRTGVEVDGARFRPHVTVARAHGVPVLRWLRVLEGLDPVGWTASDAVLIRSSSLPGGAGYQHVRRLPLDG